MKKAKLLALLIVVVMVLTGVLAACQKTHTVIYYHATTVGAEGHEELEFFEVGRETVKSGEVATGKVNGYTLKGGLKNKADNKDFDLTTPITGDTELYGTFEATVEGSQVIIGSSTQLGGDFRWTGLGQSSANASDQDVMKLSSGYATMELNKNGVYVWNETAVKSHTEEEIDHGTGEDAYKTFRITIEIKPGLKMSGGTEIKAENYLAYILAMSSPVSAQSVNYNRAGYSLVGWNSFSLYDGTNDGEEVKGKNSKEEEITLGTASKAFAGLRRLGDYKFSIEINSDNYPYYYADTLGAVSPYDLKLVLGDGVEVKDDGQGVYLSDAWYAKSGDTYSKGEHLKSARYDIDTYEYTGAYKITNWNETSAEATLEINSNFQGNFEGQKPSIQKVIYRLVVEETQFAQLSAGQIDVLSGLTGADSVATALNLAKGGKFKNNHYDRAGYGKIQFNCDFGPTMFTEVRQAIALSFDRNDFANTFCGGYGAVVHGPYSTSFDAYITLQDELEVELNTYAKSSANAIKALEDGGWIYNSQGQPYTSGVRYKKLAANELGPDNVNLTYASVSNTDGKEYKTVKIGDDYYMPLAINWFSSEDNPVSELLTTMLLNGNVLETIGMVIRKTEGDFTKLQGELSRYEPYGYGGTPVYGMYNLATGWNTSMYDYSYNWIDNSNKEMYDQFFDYSVNYLSDEYDAEFSWWTAENQGLSFDEANTKSGGKLGMNYISMAMVYSVDVGDTAEYNKWFKAYMLRWNELLPDIPLYSNIYYDCYNSKLQNFETSPFFGAADAILYATIGSNK